MLKPLIAATLLATTALAGAANPLTSRIFTADPAALVDNGRVYLYVGHDEAPVGGKDYVMNEWKVFSSCDMQNWTEHPAGVPFSTFKWAAKDAWASDVTKRNGKYYLYVTVEHKTIPGKAIGVAVSDSPTGPFVDARGTALITNDMTHETEISWDDIDPAIFVDDDGQAYLYWGNTVMKYAKLKPNMTELDGPIHTVGLDQFTEASYLHKHAGKYYLSYSRKWPEETVYMTGPTATGPWSYGGVIMEKNTNVGTIHHAIIDFNGKSYIIYHNGKLPTGGDFRRSVAIEELHYGPDGKILPVPQTEKGPAANPSAACKR
ncbi:Glycosyl hydrolases family 43 [Massilia sp. PDC64]|nr:glycoside hydrolase family 43 protein [Massilia sp. PDC64]SDC74198.1 Glycosyl hydrolases family 43 [Massilia sp. PDC64]